MTTCKVLVVDDELLILNAVERALTKVGFLVVKAADMKGLDAALAEAPFELLITDVHMQDCTAEVVIERVRSCSPSVKVLRMSGSPNESSDRFIEKPFKLDALRNVVREMLDGPF